MPTEVEIVGLNIKPSEPEKCGLCFRIYGTRKVFTYPAGRVAPQPGTWELVKEVTLRRARGRILMEPFTLEITGPGGWQFYNPVHVSPEGRETWRPDNEMTLTPAMVEEFDGEMDFPSWLLYNLELKGVIEPDQLHD